MNPAAINQSPAPAAGDLSHPATSGLEQAVLENVMAAAGVGWWEYDHATQDLIRSPALNGMMQLGSGRSREKLQTVLQRIHADDRERVAAGFAQALIGEPGSFQIDYRVLGGDGLQRWMSTRGHVVSRGADGQPRWSAGIAVDISANKAAEERLQFSNSILQKISAATPLPEVLDFIACQIEAQEPGMRVSILLLDVRDKRLHHASAPSLPAEYLAELDGIEIGSTVGACGSAAFHGRPVFSADIASDPLWVDFRQLAARFGLAACWSSPILSAAGQVLGTFAIYWQRARPEVSRTARDYVEVAARLAAIAIESGQRAAELRELNTRLQSQLEELRRWQHVTLGREQRVLELKREVNDLQRRLGEVARYQSVAGGAVE